MIHRCAATRAAGLLLTGALMLPVQVAGQAATDDNRDEDARELERVVVTTTREARALVRESSAITRLDSDTIDRIAPTHANELIQTVPGAWVTRNSGQEHLTAIRSPVLTGAGACGAFQFLEDGIPIRAAGFCNVNALFEVNTEQAGALEVIRGPANALYGSNAMHGVINVISRDPGFLPTDRYRVEVGPDEEYRAGVSIADEDGETWRVSALATHHGGWRDDSGFEQQKLNARYHTDFAGGELRWMLSGSWLDQDTAGYVTGYQAYRTRPKDNDNPEAFRQVEAERLAARWQRTLADGTQVEITPYVRHTDMDFLQHFLPGKPLEENGQKSIGAMNRITTDLGGGRLTAGLDLEWTDSFLTQTQDGPVQIDSDFLRETRPPGPQYDYDVDASHGAIYLQHRQPLGKRTRLDAGARLETIRYDYRNNLEPGNLRPDGTPCGFGGCLYTRPAARSDRFTTPTANIGLNHSLTSRHTLFGRYARGYRAPQATELYRLRSGQTVADLEPVSLDSVELGLRGGLAGMRYELAGYYMEKEHVIYRDADGFQLSNGATRHRGIEVDLRLPLSDTLTLATNFSHARHTWAFNRQDGEPIRQGDEVDEAPRHLGSARLTWTPRDDTDLSLAANYLGSHYLDAANEHRYHGHTIFSLRARYAVSDTWRLEGRVRNLTDRAYAERADYAFGSFRYFPGRGRSLHLALVYEP